MLLNSLLGPHLESKHKQYIFCENYGQYTLQDRREYMGAYQSAWFIVLYLVYAEPAPRKGLHLQK